MNKVTNRAVARASIVLTAEQMEAYRNAEEQTPVEEAVKIDTLILPPVDPEEEPVAAFVQQLTARSVAKLSRQLSGKMDEADAAALQATIERTRLTDCVMETAGDLADSAISEVMERMSRIGKLDWVEPEQEVLVVPEPEPVIVDDEKEEEETSQVQEFEEKPSLAQLSIVTFSPKHPLLTTTLSPFTLSPAQTTFIDEAVEMVSSALYAGQNRDALSSVDYLLHTIRSGVDDFSFISGGVSDEARSEFAQLRTSITLLRANCLYAMAQYSESKALFDAVYQQRVNSKIATPFIVAEIQYCLAEWHRGQAEYNESEVYYTQVGGMIQIIVYDVINCDIYLCS
jgi:hypothetical protein